jgi:hypothetical protein
MHIIFALLETDVQQPLRVSVAQQKSMYRRGWDRRLLGPEIFVLLANYLDEISAALVQLSQVGRDDALAVHAHGHVLSETHCV